MCFFFLSKWTVYSYISLVCYSSFFMVHDIQNIQFNVWSPYAVEFLAFAIA